MRTIPSWHCFIGDDQLEFVDEQQADRNFCLQTLTGDQADGYKGCVGVGHVKANRVYTINLILMICGKQSLKNMNEINKLLKTHITKQD